MSTQMSGGTEQPLYEVYDIEDTYGPTSLGGSNRIKRVLFHVVGAQDSYVDIPFSMFNAPYVAAQIEKHVQDIIDVRILKGPAV